ncbi:PLP-dependent cysteine synthase family protein [Amycolatopsis anabasis]|uniref:PLP-dependent cysteine synthase family protein n=1 Tax=Amycolatopsis anabasis TaxID=1840409 RepID=UPI00131E5450|nr:pyridoxal-phosphate dependent enzyme [Amycolatopsis anabasis]
MTSTEKPELELSVADPLLAMPDETVALDHFPGLREFRERLGNTPLVEVPGPEGGAKVLAKYEFANPFGSVKDRAAYSLLCSAINEQADRLDRLSIVDASSGNMGRALSGLGQAAGIPIHLVSPSVIPPSLLRGAREAGAVVDLVDATKGLIGLIKHAEQLKRDNPEVTVLAQLRNMANVAVHEFMTGREIAEQLAGKRPSAWVASVGSGGTIAGVARALRQRFDEVMVAGVTPLELPYGTTKPPNGDPKMAGAAGLGYGYRQPFVETLVPDAKHFQVSYPEALRGMRDYRRQTGTSIGASSAANWLTAFKVAQTLGPDEFVVTLFGDAGPEEDWRKVENLDD